MIYISLLMAFNILVNIYRAYIREQYSLLAFILFVYFSFFLLLYFSYVYRRFSSKEKSLQKDIIGLVIWFLYSAIMFGFVYQFSPILGFSAALFLYVVAIAGSAVFFYIYVVYEEDENERKWFYRSVSLLSQEQWDVISEKV
ncbi:hypothetical protein HAX54_042272 [Datura stramonium]|uniref:Uncharacterized protein n=1 Tax=Datura stramonium TaxID=4076 RepID=A0ABS8W2Y6_DATST|nr:hypothetical protein [Datura stramonium]